MSASMLEFALSYAERGWPVLPLVPRTKRPLAPLVPNGVKDATTDPERVRMWWEAEPEANIGIATGAPGPDVLDIDDYEAGASHLMDLPDGPVASTGKGEHHYFVGSEARTVGMPYGELRRQGSYVVAPPSVHPNGEIYRWQKVDSGWQRVPDWVLADRRTAGAGDGPVPLDFVPPGEMYGHLLDFAVRLARAGMLDRRAREVALEAEFRAKADPRRVYGGGPEDTRRLAAAPSEILERESKAFHPPLGGEEGMAPEDLVDRFRTPAQLRENLPAEPDWVWDKHFARGFITLVGGRPKVGKSTVVYEAVDRLVRGDDQPFLGAALHPTDVVVISEEHAVTALDKLQDSPRLHVLTREAAWPLPPWADLLAAALAKAKRTDAHLVLIDSFTFWAGMDSEAGQDAGAVQQRFNDLVALAREDVAVVLIHHQRKAGGEYGDALLGSTAFGANADNIMEVERLDEGSPGNYRRIMRTGRWYAPPVLLAAWVHGEGYHLVAEAESIPAAEDHVWTERLRGALRPYGVAVRASTLTEALGADSRKWGRAIGELIADGEVIKAGAGVQKDPFTYTAIAPEDRPRQPAI